MIAQVVPVTRLRRATDWWSYKVPAAKTVREGSLVSISFHGRTLLGVVWGLTTSDAHAQASILEVYTSTPLVREPYRRFIEWLAESGICSLSTALNFWLPNPLCRYPLKRSVREALQEFDRWQATTANLKSHPQQLVLLPGERPDISNTLSQQVGSRFSHISALDSEKAELERWFTIAKGEIQVGAGRELALTAPWLNLRQLVIVEPEDVSYFHEQIPYIDFTEAARKLAALLKARLSVRSYLPEGAAQKLWGKETRGAVIKTTDIALTDLRQQRLLNNELIHTIKRTLADGKRVIILYNAKDKKALREGQTVLIPGIETLSKQLAMALGRKTLPKEIIFGTRSILTKHYPAVGLTVVLALEPLLRQTSFRDCLHGYADLMHLFSYPVPAIIQSYNRDHPLVTALRNNSFSRYCEAEIAKQQRDNLPPFSDQIVCSLPEGKESAISPDMLHKQLSTVVSSEWKVSYPFPALRHTVPTTNILLSAASDSRLPQPVRQLLAALPRPWKVQRNPWYIM